ncbi:uncharacterized protein LOC105772004 [Gossypium raimondii]|uniref:uncharacterized protein LOC105772004 n=1 Tax=Gossypium raimondii TaxID=29730 RepID=UPI00063AA327|nr:uncharacterized protein LOC105772004 [Gossypium raimondii]
MLRSSSIELFKGVAGTTPTVIEYWLEATERILYDMECTPTQKLKGTMSFLRDEAYCRWQAISKYVGARYIGARTLQFFKLSQGSMFVTDYEASFLRLSRYSLGMVDDEQDKCTRFESGLRPDLMMQESPLQERVFEALVEKTKICDKVRYIEYEQKEQVRGLAKRDFDPSG